MNTITNITNFVRKAFDSFSISGYNYFYEMDFDIGKEIPLELFPGGVLSDERLNELEVILGIGKEDIVNTNVQAIENYLQKYPFFKLFKKYQYEFFRQTNYADDLTEEERLLAAIFGDQIEKTIICRYNEEDVERRLKKQLKQIDEFIPGTYHFDATINDLKISTETVISFPQITEMLQSFMQMLDDAKALFFKGLREELKEEEIKQYNFIASTLRIVDKSFTAIKMTYDNLKLFREIYLSENLSDYFSYVKIKSFADIEPWCCKEFCDDEALVQQLANCFPWLKQRLREFAMEATKFHCSFHWSDAEFEEPDDFERIAIEEYNEEFGGGDVGSFQKRTTVYVPKTEKEMYGSSSYLKKLNSVASPEKKGGLKSSHYECVVKGLNDEQRFRNRFNAYVEGKKR